MSGRDRAERRKRALLVLGGEKVEREREREKERKKKSAADVFFAKTFNHVVGIYTTKVRYTFWAGII